MLQLAPRPAAAGVARRWLSGLVAGWPRAAVETAQLLLSEAVTNAVLHARTPLEVRMEPAGGDRLRLEVADGVAEGPVPKRFEPDADTGRGLTLLASLADEWGVRRPAEGAGKVVWFTVGPGSGADRASEAAAAQLLIDVDDWTAHGHPPGGPRGHPASQPVGDLPGPAPTPAGGGVPAGVAGRGATPGPAGGTPRLVEVHVIGLPLALYLETEQHNDALLRELGLIVESASHGDGVSEAPRRLLELADELRSLFQPATGGIRAQVERAVQLGQSTVDLVMSVPAAGWEMLLRMADQLDEVDRYCEQGQLLTLASTPAVRQFRRWYAQEVAHQLAGHPPRPWSAGNP